MGDDKRVHPRHDISVSVKVSHPDIGEKVVHTRNVSDSGLFLITDPTDMPPPGEIIQGQVLGMMDDPPVVTMKIVRVEKEGIGLQFVES